jgi:F0F1-type ATP synthase delta subunit
MGAGAEKSEILKNFLQTLAENNRLGVLGGVCEKFEVLMGAYHGEIELNITSAQVGRQPQPKQKANGQWLAPWLV